MTQPNLRVVGKRRIATVPIYRAEKVYINGRDVTPRIRGLYDGKKIVLTRYALKGKTIHHEEGHAIDDLRHGHIVESHARQIAFSRQKKIGTIGFSMRNRGDVVTATMRSLPEDERRRYREPLGRASVADLKRILNDDTKRVEQIFRREIRRHPPGCQCPYHGGHKRGRKSPVIKGIGQAPGYRMGGKTGFTDGPIHGL
jgi:hypothetical protein